MSLSFRRGRGRPDGPADGRLVQPDPEEADVGQEGVGAGVPVSENPTEKMRKGEEVRGVVIRARLCQSQDPGAGAAAAPGGGGAAQAAGEAR